MRNEVVFGCKGSRFGFKIGRVQTDISNIFLLLDVRKELRPVVFGTLPSLFKFIARSLALDDKEGFARLVGYHNIRTPTARTMPQLPFGFELDMLGVVALAKEAMHTLQDYKIFIGSKVARLPLMHDHTRFGRVYNLPLQRIHAQSKRFVAVAK